MFVEVKDGRRTTSGCIREIDRNNLILTLSSGRRETVPCNDVKPVPPSQDDSAKVLKGKHKGEVMKCMGSEEGTIVLNSARTSDVIIVKHGEAVKFRA